MAGKLIKSFKPGAAVALFLSTSAFAVSFAVWGLIGALAPTFAQTYGLSAKAKSLMIAIPVLLGALGRIPAGMLADRFGGRRVFAAVTSTGSDSGGAHWSVEQLCAVDWARSVSWNCRLDLSGRRWLHFEVVYTRPAGYSAGRLRYGQHRAVCCGVWRSRIGDCAWVVASSVLRVRGDIRHLGCSVLFLCARCRVYGKAKDDGRKFRGVASRAVGLGLVALLLPNLRRLRRVCDLSSQFAAWTTSS